MFNPIRYIKDIVDLLRDPPRKAEAAMEIVPENIELIRNSVIESYGRAADKYVKLGDYYLEFENGSTIVPKNEFHRHYFFTYGYEKGDVTTLRPITTFKPI